MKRRFEGSRKANGGDFLWQDLRLGMQNRRIYGNILGCSRKIEETVRFLWQEP